MHPHPLMGTACLAWVCLMSDVCCPLSSLHPGTLPKGTPLEGGAGADPSSFQKAVKVADKLGERIARTTDKIMEMRQDIDGKQVEAAANPAPLHVVAGPIYLVTDSSRARNSRDQVPTLSRFLMFGSSTAAGVVARERFHRPLPPLNRANIWHFPVSAA